MYSTTNPIKLVIFSEHPDYYKPSTEPNMIGGEYTPFLAETKPEFYETLIDTLAEYRSNHGTCYKYIVIVGKDWIVAPHEEALEMAMEEGIVQATILEYKLHFVNWLTDEIKILSVY